MKRTIIFLLCVTAVIGLMLFLLRKPAQAPELAPATEIHATNSLATNNTMQQNPAATYQTPASISAPKIPEYDLTSEAEKNAKARQMLEARNKPVELWGKVVDQDGVPLSDVKVETEINHFFWPPEKAPNGVTTKQEITTDTDGQFHVSDNSATGIHVMLKKAGYDQEERNGYGSNGQNGSQENPAILKMWSTNIHEQLITGGKRFPIVPDGRTYIINLTEGTIAESGEGDLKVWVKRPEQIAYGKRYDWSCEVDVLNGGLLAVVDSFMYLAPADGYSQTFKFEQKIGSGWGDSTGEKQFYVRLNNGQVYGRITIELMAYGNYKTPGLIRLSYAINPSGSRILR